MFKGHGYASPYGCCIELLRLFVCSLVALSCVTKAMGYLLLAILPDIQYMAI